MAAESVPAMVIRGGTSKGVFFRRGDMPTDREDRNELLLDVMGSPDPKQIDGIGGGRVTTSKAMIVGESDRPGVDLEYDFGQISLSHPVIDWGGNCGNLTYAIGPFGLEAGLVEPASKDDVTLTLYNDNTDVTVEQTLSLDDDGNPDYAGDFKMYGIPGTGAPIGSRFFDPAGASTGRLFPTGNRIDTLSVPDVGEVEVSIVDVSNPVLFLRPETVGLTGTEVPDDVDAAQIDRLERIRSVACATIGMADSPELAAEQSPNLPMISLVAPPATYRTIGGDTVHADDYDILARNVAMETWHYAFAITGGMCTAAAARLQGTLANEVVRDPSAEVIELGHPMGTMAVTADVVDGEVRSTAVTRTARKIMDGTLFR